jgi:hypothetical protein
VKSFPNEAGLESIEGFRSDLIYVFHAALDNELIVKPFWTTKTRIRHALPPANPIGIFDCPPDPEDRSLLRSGCGYAG